MNLIHNPKSPREARKVEYTVYVWHEGNSKAVKENVVKWVLDIPLKNGKTVPMQIDNWKDIQNGNAQEYQLKTLYAIKPQRFNKIKKSGKSNEYDGSEIDEACGDFYETLTPEIQNQIVPVVMDKDNNYEIIELITKEAKKDSIVTYDEMAERIMGPEQRKASLEREKLGLADKSHESALKDAEDELSKGKN